MSISQNFPDLTPSLNLNFAGSKKLDSRVTFTRGSTGTYMDDNGIIKTAGINQPRFDHSFNGTSVESLGLLVEESRTNLLLQSTTPDNLVSPWGKGTNTTRIGTTTSPDGTNTAVYYSGDGSSANEFVTQSVSLSTNTTYTVSVWAKLISGSIPTSGNIISAEYNNGSGSVRSNVPFNGNITTEWKRFATTFTNVNSGTYNQFLIADQNNTAQIAIWGAQLEAGAFRTSYIPTTSTTVTRSADAASITGTNFSNWYNPNEWTLFVNQSVSSSVLLSSPAEAQNVFINDGTTNNYYAIRYVTDTTSPYIDGYANTSGVPVIDTAGSSGSTFPNPVKSIFAVKLNDSAFCYNGNTVEVDSTSTLSTSVNRMTIGGSPKTGTISQVSYYPKRLTNTQMQNLTK